MILPQEFIEHEVYSNLSMADCNLYRTIVELSIKESYCYASQEFLSKQINSSVLTIKLSVKKLAELRLITITKHNSSTGFSKNHYTPIQPIDYVNGKRAELSIKQKKQTNDQPNTNTFDGVVSYCLENYQGTDIDKYNLLIKSKALEQGRKTKALKKWKESELLIEDKITWFINALVKSINKE